MVGDHCVDFLEVPTPDCSSKPQWSLVSSILPLEGACVQVEQVEDYVIYFVCLLRKLRCNKEVVFVIWSHIGHINLDLLPTDQVDPVRVRTSNYRPTADQSLSYEQS